MEVQVRLEVRVLLDYEEYRGLLVLPEARVLLESLELLQIQERRVILVSRVTQGRPELLDSRVLLDSRDLPVQQG